MRILFMGTPDFAVASLRRLVITCILMNSSRDIMAIGRSWSPRLWILKQIRRLFISTLVVWENACKLPLANTSSINASCFARRRLDLFKSRYKSPSVGQGAV